MMAAVEAALASSALAAAQVTCAQGEAAVRPVRGSTMWWRRSSDTPVAQVRFWVEDVAKACPAPVTTWRGEPLAASMPIRQPPAGRSPAVAMSPPRLTRNPPGKRAARLAAIRSAAAA